MTEAQKRADAKFRKTEKYERNWREGWYRRTYGITYDEFLQKIKAQGNRCPIGNHLFGPSGSKFGPSSASSPLSPCMDHSHKTGKNRDVLCREHNRGISSFHDNTEELQDAITYLKRHED